MHTDLMLLAGGASSRMKQSLSEQLSEQEAMEANTKSKSLIQLEDGKPLLHFLLKNAQAAGYSRVTLVVGHSNNADFREAFGKNYLGLDIHYAVQTVPEGRIKPLGTADAVLQAMQQHSFLKTTVFTVCNSDNLYSIAVLRRLREVEAPNAMIAYDRDGLLFSEERIARFALVRLDGDHRLIDIVEKPELGDMATYEDGSGKLRVSMNIFKLTGASILPFLEQCPLHPVRNEKELPVAILGMIRSEKQHMVGIPWKEHVPDLTSKSDIRDMRKFLKDQ